MTTHTHRNEAPLSLSVAARRGVDIMLLLLLTALAAGRCLINESFPLYRRLTGPQVGPHLASGEMTAMMVFAGLIFAALLVWLTVRIRSGMTWRKTALVGPLLLFIMAGIISTCVASDKHRAAVGAVNWLGQLAAAVLLVQLLDAPWKRRLVACAIIATGVTQTYRCWEQHHYDFNEAIGNYQADPQRALAAQNIEPGSYAAEQFEERLYSRDVGGYFAISNTAAAFFILSLSVTLAVALRGWRKDNPAPLLLGAGLIGVQLFGLALTQSKGGIAAFVVAAVLALILGMVRRFFARYGKIIFFGAIVVMVMGVGAVIYYGLSHDRLPSNSMWVRWQYWTASADMITNHGLTGVGVENFGRYYPRYMDPAAPEVVSDPHSFPLAILAQWGALGFIALLWAVVAVAWRTLSKNTSEVDSHVPSSHDEIPPWGWWPWIVALAAGVFILRLSVSDLSSIVYPAERQSVILISFVVPLIIWLAAFIAALNATKKTDMERPLKNNHPAGLILGCGLLGFLLHNSIDLAIFQPGVGLLLMTATALWLSYQADTYILSAKKVSAAVMVTAALLGVYLYKAVPIVHSQALLDKAQRTALSGNRTLAQAWVQKASGADAAQMQAELAMMRRAAATGEIPMDMEELETQYFPAWIAADPENFKVYSAIGDFYRRAADKFSGRNMFREKAIEYYEQTLQRHPYKSDLLIEYAELLIDAGRDAEAMAALEKALAAEDAFLEQQRRMYPDRAPLRPRLQPALREQAQSLLDTLNAPRESASIPPG